MLCPAGRGLAKTLIPADPGACSGAEDCRRHLSEDSEDCRRHLSDSYCPSTLNRMNEDRTGVPKIAKESMQSKSEHFREGSSAGLLDEGT